MKHLFFYLPLTLLVLVVACKGKKNASVEPSADIIQEPDTIPVEAIAELPPLEAGEVYLKGKNIFGEDVELTGTHIEEPDTFVFKLIEPKMVIKDSLLILSSMNAPFYVFHFPQFTYVKTIGIRGNGPDEFQNPIVVQSLDPAYLCYLLDGYNGKIYGLNCNLEKHFIKTIFNSKSQWDYIEHAYSISDKALVYRMGGSIVRASLEGDSVQTEKIHSLRLEQAKKMPTQGTLNVNPLRNRMVYAYKYAKFVKFMDLEAKTVRILNFEQSGFDEQTLNIANGLDSNVSYYMQVLPTRDYVYITYSGRTPYVVAAEIQKGNRYMYLEKYDWNGNPIKRYKLNDFCVCCVIDEKTNQIALPTFYHDDPFVVYQLDE
ncbi:BF3164 family lipoprotein [Parabacteroides sp. AM08-6]|uniref:BF3164 family lipoprotein n=1 Tax=Parabacteroides sp. AM08-6 TaxID=2292053 RepID=UPI000EFEC1C1|nr:BF3164 family lipoprotein [Parabacteroides sp. AM08-6]RHJ78240.1 hypothetical protein DW103_15120 [Parabacteroides sp. AM08-6]